MVERIQKKNGFFEIITKNKNFKALRVILAIGKSGNARMLKVPGENLPKVYNRLFDPADAKDHDVLVVGGGDSAIETAISVSDYAKHVTLSYRNAEFSRPKEGNLEKLNRLSAEGKINVRLQTQIKEVRENTVILVEKDKTETELNNSMIFTMIGRELPTEFFKRSGIKMEGELSLTAKLQFALLLLISGVIYFGKSSEDFYQHFFGKLNSWSEVISGIFNADFWGKFIALPGVIVSVLFSDTARIWNVTKYINAGIAYFAFIGAVLLGLYLLYKFSRDYGPQIKLNWQTFKYFYFVLVGMLFYYNLFWRKIFWP